MERSAIVDDANDSGVGEQTGQTGRQRRANIRLAVALGCIAVAIYLGFILMHL